MERGRVGGEVEGREAYEEWNSILWNESSTMESME